MKKIFLLCTLLFFATTLKAQRIGFETWNVKKSGLTTAQGDTLQGRNIFDRSLSGLAGTLYNGSLPDTLWYLTSTGKDTSRVYALKSGSVQFRITINDTSTANDSAGTRLKIYQAPRSQFGEGVPGFAAFVFQDSVDFKPGTTSSGVKADDDIATTGVNGQGVYSYTFTYAGSNRQGWYFWYVTLEGITGVNKILSAVSNVLEVTYVY